MERFRIQAASPQSAHAMLAALSEFRPELSETAEGCEVVIALGGANEVVPVLNAIEQYVRERGSGPAQMEFNGHAYVMHPAPNAE
ncbi:MAG: hypothetical protein ACJ76O_12295 [Gaiellaceae bacterium]